MNKEKLIRIFTLRGLDIYPQPIVDSEVNKLVKKFLRGGYGDKTLEEVWQEKIKEHREYWHIRFGLNIGHKLIENPDRIHGFWDDHHIYTTIGAHPQVTTYFPEIIRTEVIMYKLESFCIRYLARYNLKSINFPKHTFSFKDYPTPEWDWEVWREKALMKTDPISALDHYLIDTLIRRYKTGKLQGDPDAHLNELIKLSYKG